MAGRGVDIILGGNPELLARQEVLKEGFAPDLMVDDFALPRPLAEMPEEYREDRAKAWARYGELLAEVKQETAADGDKVRELGGLLRDRLRAPRLAANRQPAPWPVGPSGRPRREPLLPQPRRRVDAPVRHRCAAVGDGRFDDDEAIEAKMVTKAIERAQTTVEQKNAEIRKNVLKYDEVMNEQRRVIYMRRDQILEGEDLQAAATEYLAEAVDALIETHCQSVADRRVGRRRARQGAGAVLADQAHRRRAARQPATPMSCTTW